MLTLNISGSILSRRSQAVHLGASGRLVESDSKVSHKVKRWTRSIFRSFNVHLSIDSLVHVSPALIGQCKCIWQRQHPSVAHPSLSFAVSESAFGRATLSRRVPQKFLATPKLKFVRNRPGGVWIRILSQPICVSKKQQFRLNSRGDSSTTSEQSRYVVSYTNFYPFTRFLTGTPLFLNVFFKTRLLQWSTT